MLLPDSIYRRLPQLWTIMGVFLVIFGIVALPDLKLFAAYMALGIISLGRSVWIHQARQRVVRRGEVTVLTDTQKIERNIQ
jgi:hypothetical protein